MQHQLSVILHKSLSLALTNIILQKLMHDEKSKLKPDILSGLEKLALKDGCGYQGQRSKNTSPQE